MHNLLSKRFEACSHHEKLRNPYSCLQLSLHVSTTIVQLFSLTFEADNGHVNGGEDSADDSL